MIEMTAAHKGYLDGMECVRNIIIDDAVRNWIIDKRMGYDPYDDWLEAVASSVADAIKCTIAESESNMRELFDTV